MVKRPPTGTIPDAPGSYQFKDAQGRVIYVGKASSLRQRLSNYFGDPRGMHQRTAQMVATADTVEWTTVRNEVEALMLEYSLDQGAQPAVQRPPARRQELPVPRRHRRRAVAAGAGHARPQAQGHAVLRPVRPRLRHPRHARRAAALVPDPHVQPGEVPPARAPRPAVPAVPHREVHRPVRRRDRGDALPPAGHRAVRLPRGRHRADRQAPRGRDARRGDGAGVREGGPPARPPADRAAGDRAPADGRRHVTRTSTSSASPATSWRRRCRCSTCARAGSSGARGWCVDKVEDLTPGGLVSRILENLYGEDPPQGVPKQVLVPGRARRRGDVRGVAGAAPGVAGAGARARSGATSGRCWRRSRATPRRSSPATACAGRATTTRAAGR